MDTTRQINPRQSSLPIGDADPAPLLRYAPGSTSGGNDAPVTPGFVEVMSGTMQTMAPVAGLTVGEVRAAFSAPFRIAESAHALIGGRPAAESERLTSGTTLEFARIGGEKGALPS